ncbi:MAG: helix-hairpin-helix domain-containing protein [Promethearchaeota archaeon]
MANSNMINSADKWNLNQTYDKIKDMTNLGKYAESIKLAKKGLSMACQTNNKSWVEKFDDILMDVINQHNQVKSPEPQSNAKVIFNVKVHNKPTGSEKALTKIKGIGASVEKKLNKAGIETINQLASSRTKEIAKIKGIGLNTAMRLISEAHNYLNELNSEKNSKLPIKEKFQEEKVDDIYYRKNKQEDKGLVKFLAEKKTKDPSLENKLTIDSLNNSNFNYEDNQSIILEPKINEEQEEIDQIIENNKDSHSFDDDGTSFTTENLYHEHLDEDNEFDLDYFDFENESANSTKDYNESGGKEDFLGQLDYEKFNKESVIEHSTDLNYIIKNEHEIEKLEKIVIQKNVKNIENHLRSLNYRIIPKNSTLLNELSKTIDILAFKTLEINKKVSLILVFPVKFCDLKGNLIISDKSIDYNQYNQNLKLNEGIKHLIIGDFVKELKYDQDNLFQSIIYEGKLFHYFKKSINKRIRVEKTKKNLRLFIRSGNMIFKVVVDPLLICQQDPAFLEKSVIFPYQKKSNLHIIKINTLTDLIHFLEKKYMLIETHTEERNPIVSYFKALEKFRFTIRNYSIPFLFFGAVFCLIILLQNLFLIPMFTNLGYAAIGIYAIMLGYSYLRFSKTQKAIVENYKIPYYQNKINLDETDLTIIKDDLPPELLNQFIYECLGKNTDYSFTAEIEERKADILISDFKRNKEIESSDIPADIKINKIKNFESNKIRGKIISKYSSFLED